MKVFEYSSYKQYVNAWIKAQPHGGHGQLRRLAEELNVNSVVMSQVFRGERELTLEQTVQACAYFGLSDLERDYFLLLVQKARAGSKQLEAVIDSQLEAILQQSKALKNRIKHSLFTEEDRATFYSNWYYSAIRLASSLDELNSPAAIADRLNLDRVLVAKVMNFLITHGLIVEKSGRLDIGPQVTHVGHDSPFVHRHHTNWRLKGLLSLEKNDPEALHYTGPMALSRKAKADIREDLISLIEKATKRAAPSDSETLACLNVDWFDY